MPVFLVCPMSLPVTNARVYPPVEVRMTDALPADQLSVPFSACLSLQFDRCFSPEFGLYQFVSCLHPIELLVLSLGVFRWPQV